MRILIVNYRYFISGGPERYMFNIMSVLKSHGHEVIPFSVRSSQNEPTEYEKYFVDPIGGMDAVYYEDYKKTPKNLWKMFSRAVYSTEVKKALEKEIREVKPDVVYVLQCINKLSPSVITAAVNMGVPAVWRLSDYQFMCAKFDFLRDGHVCEECVHKGLYCAVRNRCVKDSLAASLVRVTAMRIQRMLKIHEKVSAYVTPSAFLRDKLIENGYDGAKIYNIPTFSVRSDSPDDKEEGTSPDKCDHAIYFGRIAAQKDLGTVIKAYEKLPDHKLKIVGDDTTDEALRLKQYVRTNKIDNVEFAGFMSGKALSDAVMGSRFSVMPSIWYENLPNSALESLRYGRPVIASDIGSLKELVNDNVNGYAYTPGDVDSLMECIRKMDDDDTVRRMGTECKKMIDTKFSEDNHYEQLIKVFEQVIRDQSRKESDEIPDQNKRTR